MPGAEFTHWVCPRCGSPLLTDGNKVWCSFVGGQGKTSTPACTYGLDTAIQPAPVTAPAQQ